VRRNSTVCGSHASRPSTGAASALSGGEENAGDGAEQGRVRAAAMVGFNHENTATKPDWKAGGTIAQWVV
jgi:hypothetical protein